MEVFLRLPFSENFLWTNHLNEGDELVKFTSFDEQKTLNIFSKKFEILDEKRLTEKLSQITINQEFRNDIIIPQHKDYIAKLEKTIALIKENNLPKLVISRAIQKTISNISIEKSYLQLAQNFKNTLCYLLISLTTKYNRIQTTKQTTIDAADKKVCLNSCASVRSLLISTHSTIFAFFCESTTA